MKGYVLSVAFAVIICLGASLLTPSERYRGIVKIVCGVFVVSAILSPIKVLLKGNSMPDLKFNNYGADQFDDIAQSSSEKFKNDISQNTKNLLNSRISEELTKLIGKKVKADLGEDVLFAEGVPAEEQPGVEKYILENYGLKTVFK